MLAGNASYSFARAKSQRLKPCFKKRASEDSVYARARVRFEFLELGILA
jgi:hypothetical protein